CRRLILQLGSKRGNNGRRSRSWSSHRGSLSPAPPSQQRQSSNYDNQQQEKSTAGDGNESNIFLEGIEDRWGIGLCCWVRCRGALLGHNRRSINFRRSWPVNFNIQGQRFTETFQTQFIYNPDLQFVFTGIQAANVPLKGQQAIVVQHRRIERHFGSVH